MFGSTSLHPIPTLVVDDEQRSRPHCSRGHGSLEKSRLWLDPRGRVDRCLRYTTLRALRFSFRADDAPWARSPRVVWLRVNRDAGSGEGRTKSLFCCQMFYLPHTWTVTETFNPMVPCTWVRLCIYLLVAKRRKQRKTGDRRRAGPASHPAVVFLVYSDTEHCQAFGRLSTYEIPCGSTVLFHWLVLQWRVSAATKHCRKPLNVHTSRPDDWVHGLSMVGMANGHDSPVVFVQYLTSV